MIPRGAPDIGWRDLLAALGYGLMPEPARRAQATVEARWSPHDDTLACLSVRSGFDLLLQVLAFPPGTEILMSAVTIPDMLHLVRQHGLVPIPLDLDPQTLAVDAAQVEHLVGPATKALLVAHLFGIRTPLDPLMAAATQHGLVVIEDCAQVYDASPYRGHPASDVSLFSFGPIKLQTALGGALLRVRNRTLLAQLRQRQAAYPRQSRVAFLRRVGRFVLLKALAQRWAFMWLILLCRLWGHDHDQLINQAVRGFAGPDLLRRLRHQPAVPLLRLLDRRVRHADPRRIARRAVVLNQMVRQAPALARPGALTAAHLPWIVPIESAAPDTLVRVLWAHGYDATRKASSLVLVPPSPQRPGHTTPQAQRLLERVVYLPVSDGLTAGEAARLRRIIIDVADGQRRLERGAEPGRA